jgi:Major Facilitator Superfamily/Cyclic nucleotide-binding domain
LEIAYLLFAVSEFGTWVSVLVYAFDRGGAPLAGLAAALQLLPGVAIAPVFSVFVDRFRRDLPLRMGYLAQSIAYGAVGVAMLNGAHVAVVIALAAVAATAITVTRPAHGSLVPELATRPDEVTAANVVTSTAEGMGVLAGPAIAGLILLGGDPGHVFLAMSGFVLVAATLVFGVRGLPPLPHLSESTRSNLLAGIRTIRSDRDLRAIVTVGASSYILVGAFDVLGVFLAIDVLGWGQAGAGALASAGGFGTLIGAMAAAALVGRRLSRALLLAVVVAALPLALLGWLSFAAVVLFFLASAGIQWTQLITQTLVQRAAPAAALGRVLGVHEGLAGGALAVGSLLVSGLFASVGSVITFLVLGMVLPVSCAFSWSRIRKLERTAPARLVELDLLKKVPMFSRLSPLVLETLAAALGTVVVDDGATVVKEREPGDSLYLIAEGDFIVEKDGRELARLGPGDVFGEIALLYDVPRTATVRSASFGRLYTLSDHEFFMSMGATGDAKKVALGLADQRLDEQLS